MVVYRNRKHFHIQKDIVFTTLPFKIVAFIGTKFTYAFLYVILSVLRILRIQYWIHRATSLALQDLEREFRTIFYVNLNGICF